MHPRRMYIVIKIQAKYPEPKNNGEQACRCHDAIIQAPLHNFEAFKADCVRGLRMIHEKAR